ncbi:MAG: YheU family protein [Halieaceae bacterium]|jgi:uncharacterized protein|nr:YheU family protein [Halieaceae bacterium]
MSQFLEIPVSRIEPDVLQAMLEEFASRDGTDYSEQERSLAQKVESLQSQLSSGELAILYDTSGEHWDLIQRDRATELLNA